MNPEVLEYIYLNYQPNQYYHKYLKEKKQRTDGRNTDQQRNVRVSAANNSVTLSRDNTIIIAQLNTNIQQVVYSPISNSYGKQLITIVATPLRGVGKFSKFERNSGKAVESYVNDFINWKEIQPQLVYQSPQKSATYAHVGQISLRVADNDGCLQQTALLAVQFLLWTISLDSISSKIDNTLKNKNQSQSNDNKFSLKLSQFWFPVKYCQILDELIIDPSKKQQQASNYQITFIGTIKSDRERTKPFHIINQHKAGSIHQSTIQALEKLYLVELSKLALNIEEFQKKCLQGQQTLTISGL